MKPTQNLTRLRAAIALAFTGLVIVSGHARPATAATINRNLNSYVLFAFESIDFKGQNGNPNPPKGVILGGNVGVNTDASSNPNENHLNMGGGGGSHNVVMSPGTQVAAHRMSLGGSHVVVGDVFANVVAGNTLQATRESGPTAYAAPIISDTPLGVLGFTPNRAITNGAADVTVNNGQTLNLLLGNYRDIQVKDDATINFGPGTYNLRNLVGGKDIKIGLTDSTIILVDGEFTVNNNALIGAGTTGLAQIKTGSFGVGANDASIKFSQESKAHGQFYAPLGILNLGNNTDLFGRFIANKIGSDFNVNVTFVSVPEPAAAMLLVAGLLAAVGAGARRRG